MDISNEPPGAYGGAVDGSRWVAAAMLVKQIVRDELGAVAARVKRLAVRAVQARYGMTATTGTTGHGLADLTGAGGNVVCAAGETGSAHTGSDRKVPQRLSFGGANAATDRDLDADLAAWLEPAASRPRIGVLGEVRVEAPGQPPADRQGFYAEIAVLLAVMGTRGVTAAELEEAIWPGRPITAASRRVALSRVRRWLGCTATGRPWLPSALPDRRYRLLEGYLLDWNLFRRLRARGEQRAAAGVEDLRRALELVRGTPLLHATLSLHGSDRTPYSWVDSSPLRPGRVAAAVADTAHRLAGLALSAGDSATARWAIEQGQRGGSERLTDHLRADLIRVSAADGNRSELRELLEEVTGGRAGELLLRRTAGGDADGVDGHTSLISGSGTQP